MKNIEFTVKIFSLQNKSMPYQIREFHLLFRLLSKNQNLKFDFFQSQHSFPDVYVFKQESLEIGVKFRNIKTKNYGFKIKSVQIKINQQALYQKHGQISQNVLTDPHFLFYQNWKKYQVNFKYRLLKPSVYQDFQEIQRLKKKDIEKVEWKNENSNYEHQINMKYLSFESQLQHLNFQLTETIRNYLSKKSELKGQIYQDNFITKWLKEDNSIKELFVIYKMKCKTQTWQTGKLLVQTFSGKMFELEDHKEKNHKLKILLIQTFSQEGNNKAFIQSKFNPIFFEKSLKSEQKTLNFDQIYNLSDEEEKLVSKNKNGGKFNHNTSYPQLIEDLYNFLLLKK